MARDIRNVERGACVDGCRSCPNFLSVEPGRVLCDYCGCPPAKHEMTDPQQLTIQENRSNDVQEKEFESVKRLKNNELCFSASRTSSNDSGCYISCSSFDYSVASGTSSSSSCSSYISEEETEGAEDDCFIAPKLDKMDEKLSSVNRNKADCLESKHNQHYSGGLHGCAGADMVVKIRTKQGDKCQQSENGQLLYSPLINIKVKDASDTSCSKCGDCKIRPCNHKASSDKVKYPIGPKLNSVVKTCKREVKVVQGRQAEGCAERELLSSTPSSNSSSEEESIVEESSTLQEMCQLDIGEEEIVFTDIVCEKGNSNQGNKIIRGEGDCDVSHHHNCKVTPEAVDGDKRSGNVGLVQRRGPLIQK